MKHKHKVMYMEIAGCLAKTSSAKRLQVGSVIVKDNNIISTGYNALPAHLHGPLEDENNITLPEVRHSEKNALMGLVRSNESAVGAAMFCTHACCKFCAIDIVDAGIVKFIYRDVYRSDEGLKHLINSGVEVERFVY